MRRTAVCKRKVFFNSPTPGLAHAGAGRAGRAIWESNTSANSPTSPGGASRPVVPTSMSSATPPTSMAMIGQLQAMPLGELTAYLRSGRLHKDINADTPPTAESITR